MKEHIYTILRKANGYVSGQSLASELNISRSAVWKHISGLRRAGCEIESAKGGGYRLVRGDLLSSDEISRISGLPSIIYESVPSTNTLARELLSGAEHGTIIVADRQTGGRGRCGKSFASPRGGVYMSVILKTELPLADASLLTLCASVAVCRTISALTGCEAQIKWVNDIFLNGKKICGILTEAIGDCERGVTNGIIVGIGLNLNTVLPRELSDTAGVLQSSASRNEFIAQIARNLITLTPKDCIDEYRARSYVLGKEVVFMQNGVEKVGLATAITDRGGLTVRLCDGVLTLNSGEISVRVK